MRRGRPRKICSHSFAPAKKRCAMGENIMPQRENINAYSPTKVYAK